MWNKEHGCLKIGGKLGILEVEITESRFFNFGGRHLSYFHKRTFGFLGTGAQSWRRALQVVGLLDQATPSGRTPWPRSTNNTNRRGTPPPVNGKPHKQMFATPLYKKCTLQTPSHFLFLCLFHLRDTPSLHIILNKLCQPSPWLYIFTRLFRLELTLSLSFVKRLLDTQELSCSRHTRGR